MRAHPIATSAHRIAPSAGVQKVGSLDYDLHAKRVTSLADAKEQDGNAVYMRRDGTPY